MKFKIISLVTLSFIFSCGLSVKTTTTTTSPQVPTTQIQALAAGAAHTCAVVNSSAKCWGNNDLGQLGDGTTGTTRLKPVQVIGLDSGVTNISTATAHSCAIVKEALYCWGLNTFGQLGDGTTIQRLKPTPVVGLTSGVTAVKTGAYHTCAIVNGSAKCWGSNYKGQLGDGTQGILNSKTIPTQVSGLTTNVTAISSGEYHSCAVANKSAVCWGANTNGQIGDGSISNIRATPVQVSSLTNDVQSIFTGRYHTCALRAGESTCWGDNTYGQIGSGVFGGNILTPTPVVGLSINDSTILTAGTYHSCAIENGSAKCWGNNDLAQLGNGSITFHAAIPTQVNFVTSGATAISTVGHSCAIVKNTIQCWGINSFGQFGDGNTSLLPSFEPVTVLGL